MDRERLTELLGTPGDVSRSDLADLRDLAERFPWFSGARLLLAVGEDKAGDVLANDRSTSPAAQLPSRAVLFDLTRGSAPRPLAPMQVVRNTAELDVVRVMSEAEKPAVAMEIPKPAELPKVETAATTPTKVAISSEEVEISRKPVERVPLAAEFIKPIEHSRPTIENPSVEVAQTPALPVEPVAKASEVEAPRAAPPTLPVTQGTAVQTEPVPKPVPPAQAAAHPVALDETPVTPVENAAIPPETKAADPLELLYREAAANAPFNVADLEILPPVEAVEPPVAEPIAKVRILDRTPEPEVELHKEPPPPAQHAPLVAGTKLRFTDWLAQADGAPRAEMFDEEARMPTVRDILHLAESGHASEALPSPEEIMDRFIQHESPAPIKAKAEFFSPQQAAKKSLLDAGLVSETLGRIYEKQGNFAKAKEVYEQLAQLDPRKSVYFAALSKALQGRMNP